MLAPVPELPDVALYVEALAARARGARLARVRVETPFVLRTVDPPLAELEGRSLTGVRRLGKRVVLELDGGLFLVIHLMVAGRLHWADAGRSLPKRAFLAVVELSTGALGLTEAGTKRRASLHAVRGEAGLRALDRGGIEPLACTRGEFAERLRRERHTLKRALTDPRILSGIGNAYSDEILHRARLSPFQLTRALDEGEVGRLFDAVRDVLSEWTERLRAEAGGQFPQGVTAFRPEMAVHGRYRRPCPVCGTPVQRIVHAETECNYCPRCQTGGRVLADRVLSRLLKDDWPKTANEL
jgi:formamidopyrimidine-DNA glycosylase